MIFEELRQNLSSVRNSISPQADNNNGAKRKKCPKLKIRNVWNLRFDINSNHKSTI